MTTNEMPSMLFLKRQLRTRLDMLHPDIQATVNDRQACQKRYHDLYAKQRHLSNGSTVKARNFGSNVKWHYGVIITCVAPLTYLVQLQDGRIWKRHVDHIVVTADDQLEKPPISVYQDPQTVHEADWSYAIASGSNASLPTSPAEQNNSRGTCNYPTRSYRPLQRLIEQTDL